jgi:hypothetical protein
LMVRGKLAVLVKCVPLVESVTVMTTVLVPPAAGVPVICPAALIVRFAGKPVALNVYGAVPPLAVTDVVYGAPATPLGSDVVLITKAAPMVRGKLAVLVKCVPVVESVTVMTTVLLPAAAGVPVICPAALIVRFAGNPVALNV